MAKRKPNQLRKGCVFLRKNVPLCDHSFWVQSFLLILLSLLLMIRRPKNGCREYVSMGAAGAQTRRSLGHHLLHPQILRLLVLLAPADFEVQSSLFIEQTALTDPNS